MADHDQQRATEEEAVQESPTGSFVKKLFTKKNDEAAPNRKEGIAQIPSTMLTVEYVDDSEGMDAALKDIAERLGQVEQHLSSVQETQSRLVSAVNQQAKDIGRIVESLSRRIDRLYRRVSGGESAPSLAEAGPDEEAAAEREPMEARAPLATASAGLAPDVADDPDHQNAWRIARVLAADLEAYHEEAVREGVLYGTFYSVLREPMEKARQTYDQRVSPEIVEGYDYFSKAIDELIARKRVELEAEGAL